jgi:hypothetical protein
MFTPRECFFRLRLELGNHEYSWSLCQREENFMASNPEMPPPDTINPQSPIEMPPDMPPAETPFQEPPEIAPEVPNIDEPDEAPSEAPAPDQRSR